MMWLDKIGHVDRVQHRLDSCVCTLLYFYRLKRVVIWYWSSKLSQIIWVSFPTNTIPCSCERNPFICLKTAKPFFECMYTVKRNSDCRTMTTFVNHFLTQDYGSKGRPKVLQRFEVKSFCEILSLEKNYNNWANKWYLMGGSRIFVASVMFHGLC